MLWLQWTTWIDVNTRQFGAYGRLPLYIISIQMCLSACLKRFCMKPPKIRFSYSDFPRRV